MTGDDWCHDLAKSAAAVSSYAANHLGELIKLTLVLCTSDRTECPIPSTEYGVYYVVCTQYEVLGGYIPVPVGTLPFPLTLSGIILPQPPS
jgi:hypothetical protein